MDPAWVKHTYIANPDDPDDQAKISRMCVNGAEDGVVGLDSEWNPNRPEGMPPNTLQICARDDVLVVQLSSYSSMDQVPGVIRALLDDQSILKAGVGVKSDQARLQGVGWVELARLGPALFPQLRRHKRWFAGFTITSKDHKMFHVPISIGNGAYMHDPAVRTADVPLPFELFDPAHATRVHPCFVAENGDITYAQALEYSLPVPHLGLTYRFRFAKDDGYFDDIWISLSQPLKVKLTYKRGDVPGLVTRVAVQFAQFAMTVLEMGFGNNARTMVASLEPPPASALSLRLSHAGGTVRLWGSGGGLVVVHEVEVPLRSQNAISLEFLAIKLLKAPLDKDPALKQGPWDTPSVRHRNYAAADARAGFRIWCHLRTHPNFEAVLRSMQTDAEGTSADGNVEG